VNVGFLYGASEWIIGSGFFLVFAAALEAGYRAGYRAAPIIPDKTRSQITAIETALLALLGLLLGFTMLMAVSRFDTRKQGVVEEANAIGTCYLRAQLFPPTEATAIPNLLRDYVDARLQYASVSDWTRVKQAREKALALQAQMWWLASAQMQKDTKSVPAGLLLESLNRVIDIEAVRWSLFNNYVPESVIYINALVAMLASVLVGYGFGLARRRHLFSMLLLVVSITVVLVVIVDLDRPRHGLIQVSQQPMIDLQQQLAKSK